MADWQQGFYYTMKWEDSGLTGVVTHDSGGTTRFGISANAHPDVYPEMAECDVETALQIAKNIYRKDYWCGDRIASQDVANKIVDVRFNAGCREGVLLAQRAAGVTEDGIWGPETEAAVNGTTDFLFAYRSVLLQHYVNIVAANPHYAIYEKGWENRVAG